MNDDLRQIYDQMKKPSKSSYKQSNKHDIPQIRSNSHWMSLHQNFTKMVHITSLLKIKYYRSKSSYHIIKIWSIAILSSVSKMDVIKMILHDERWWHVRCEIVSWRYEMICMSPISKDSKHESSKTSQMQYWSSSTKSVVYRRLYKLSIWLIVMVWDRSHRIDHERQRIHLSLISP